AQAGGAARSGAPGALRSGRGGSRRDERGHAASRHDPGAAPAGGHLAGVSAGSAGFRAPGGSRRQGVLSSARAGLRGCRGRLTRRWAAGGAAASRWSRGGLAVEQCGVRTARRSGGAAWRFGQRGARAAQRGASDSVALGRRRAVLPLAAQSAPTCTARAISRLAREARLASVKGNVITDPAADEVIIPPLLPSRAAR